MNCFQILRKIINEEIISSVIEKIVQILTEFLENFARKIDIILKTSKHWIPILRSEFKSISSFSHFFI